MSYMKQCLDLLFKPNKISKKEETKREKYIKDKKEAKERILKALEEKPLTFSQILKKSKTGLIMGQFALSSLERENKVTVSKGRCLKWQKVK